MERKTDSPRQGGLLGDGQSWEPTSSLFLRPAPVTTGKCMCVGGSAPPTSSYFPVNCCVLALCLAPYTTRSQETRFTKNMQEQCKPASQWQVSPGSLQRTTPEGFVNLKPMHSSRVGKTHIIKGRAYGKEVPQIGERRDITIHCPRVINSSSGRDRVRSLGSAKALGSALPPDPGSLLWNSYPLNHTHRHMHSLVCNIDDGQRVELGMVIHA